MIDGDTGLTRGDADGVTDPGVDRMLRVQPTAGGVCDEGGRTLITSGMNEELKTVFLASDSNYGYTYSLGRQLVQKVL